MSKQLLTLDQLRREEGKMKSIRTLLPVGAAICALYSAPVSAQETWDGMSLSSVKGEVQKRYDEALARTTAEATVNANDPRYLWASEAKVQCGIALGYLKSSTRDPVSLGKCRDAYERMNAVPKPKVAPLPPPPPPGPACTNELPGLIFFEFDSAEPGSDAAQVVDFVAQNAGPCAWRHFNVVGNTDRSGSNAYNLSLSQRRADAVAQLMSARGIAPDAITTTARGEENPRVPTADGVRELQNRRVEILVNE
jgi:OOP family OmpA-OmpF porin